jgi:hypothetical protein
MPDATLSEPRAGPSAREAPTPPAGAELVQKREGRMRGLRRTISLALVVMVAACFLAGCGDDDGAKPKVITLADFEGSWVVQSYKVTRVASPQITVDVTELGAAFSFDADDAGNFTARAFIPASLAGTTLELSFGGAFTLITQDTTQVNFSPEIPPFLTSIRGHFTLAGNTMTITDTNTTFDFDGDQVEEPAIFEGVMVRNDGSIPPIVFRADFEGSWAATEYKITKKDDAMVSVELISLGGSLSWDAQADGSFSGEVSIPAALVPPSGLQFSFTGTFAIVKQDSIRITFDQEVPPFLTSFQGGFSLSGDTVTVTDHNTTFDFDGDEVEEDAIFEGTMVRS